MSGEQSACLVRIRKGLEKRAHIVVGAEFVIGRSPDVEVPIVAGTISRRHLKVEILKDSIRITDLNTNNGTMVDGVPLAAGRALIVDPANRVRLGGTEEEITFLSIPMPMELQKAPDLKANLQTTLIHVQKEIEDSARRKLDEERQKFYAGLQLEREHNRLQLQTEANEKLKATEARARDIMEQAQKEVQHYQAKAFEDQLKRKKEVEIQIAKLQAEADQILGQARARGDDEAERIQHQAHEKARTIIEAAQKKSEMVVHAAEELYQQKLNAQEDSLNAVLAKKKEMEAHLAQMKQEAKGLLDEARVRAEREARLHVDQRKQEADELLAKAKLESQQRIETSRKKAETILAEAQDQIRRQVEEERRVALDEARLQALEERERVVREFKTAVQELEDRKDHLTHQVRGMTSEAEGLSNRVGALKSEAESLDRHLVEKRKILSQTEGEIHQAQRIIEQSRVAETARQEADAEVRSLKTQIEELKNEHQRKIHECDLELQAKREKLVLEFETFERRQADEMAKSKLEAQNRLRVAILEEEAKYKETLKMRALEISQALEKKLLPSFREDPGNLLTQIQTAVESVVVTEKSAIQAVTEGMGVDPEKEKQKRENRRKYLAVAGVALVVVLAAFGSRIYGYLERVARDNGYVEQMVAKRAAESIYSPLQSDDWRETYVGNIIYLRNYHEAKVDSAYEKQWTLKLHDLELLRSLKMNEDEMTEYIAKESALIEQLWELREAIDARYLDEGLAKMNEAEVQATDQLRLIAKTDESYSKLRRLERDFTLQYLKRRFGPDHRTPSNESK